MSRAYRLMIPLARLGATPEEGVVLDFELMPILEMERMIELFEQAFRERGAKDGQGERAGKLVLGRANRVELIIDVAAGALTIELAHIDHDVEVWIDEESLSRDQAARLRQEELRIDSDEELEKIPDHVKQMIEREAQGAQRVVLQEVNQARKELHDVLRGVYRDAVKEKARAMGNVTSVTESEHEGEYRIRIELDS